MTEQLKIFYEDNLPEDENREYKTSSKGRMPNDIWEPVTAFANAEGGTIFFGVDKDGNSLPLSNDEIDLIQRNILADINGSYSYKLNPAINHSHGVVKVYIPPAPAPVRPVHSLKRGAQKGSKVRVGSSNVQVDEEWIKRFAIASRGGAEAMTFEAEYDEVLDMNEVEKFIKRIDTRRGGVYGDYTTLEVARKLSIISKEDKVSLFGLLAFAKDTNLQDIGSPTLTIVVTQYPGTEKVSGNGSETYIDNREFYGPIRKQYEKSLQFILSKIPIRGIVGGSGLRSDEYTIPYNAVREALANTFAHRDYSVMSSRIQIDIYSDRIEFINPGRSLVPIQDLEHTPSVTRNPHLMNYLREIGATEQLARGIRTIKYELRKAGLREPSFANIGNSFVATIFYSAFIPQDDRVWLDKFKHIPLNERQRAGLIALKDTGALGISNSEYRHVNGMTQLGDDKIANKDLRKLVGFNILIKQGENKATRYIINEDF